MIETVTCHRVKCDGCELVKDYAGEGDALFYSYDEAFETLSREDWDPGAVSGRVLCPRCVCDRDGHPQVRYGFCVVCDRRAEPSALYSGDIANNYEPVADRRQTP